MGFVRYFVTTGDLNEIALIVTPDVTFAVSPANAGWFRRELIERVERAVRTRVVPAQDGAAQAPAPSPLRDLTLCSLIWWRRSACWHSGVYISVALVDACRDPSEAMPTSDAVRDEWPSAAYGRRRGHLQAPGHRRGDPDRESRHRPVDLRSRARGSPDALVDSRWSCRCYADRHRRSSSSV